jgi:hypothetical protein
MRYELTIPEPTPSLNRTQRRHWTHGYALKKRWNKLVWAARCETIAGSYEALPRARVTVTRYAPYPIRDRDNLYGGCKNLMDALVSNGLIQDDSSEHIDLHVRQGAWQRGAIKRTHVLIEPVTA